MRSLVIKRVERGCFSVIAVATGGSSPGVSTNARKLETQKGSSIREAFLLLLFRTLAWQQQQKESKQPEFPEEVLEEKPDTAASGQPELSSSERSIYYRLRQTLMNVKRAADWMREVFGIDCDNKEGAKPSDWVEWGTGNGASKGLRIIPERASQFRVRWHDRSRPSAFKLMRMAQEIELVLLEKEPGLPRTAEGGLGNWPAVDPDRFNDEQQAYARYRERLGAELKSVLTAKAWAKGPLLELRSQWEQAAGESKDHQNEASETAAGDYAGKESGLVTFLLDTMGFNDYIEALKTCVVHAHKDPGWKDARRILQQLVAIILPRAQQGGGPASGLVRGSPCLLDGSSPSLAELFAAEHGQRQAYFRFVLTKPEDPKSYPYLVGQRAISRIEQGAGISYERSEKFNAEFNAIVKYLCDALVPPSARLGSTDTKLKHLRRKLREDTSHNYYLVVQEAECIEGHRSENLDPNTFVADETLLGQLRNHLEELLIIQIGTDDWCEELEDMEPIAKIFEPDPAQSPQ